MAVLAAHFFGLIILSLFNSVKEKLLIVNPSAKETKSRTLNTHQEPNEKQERLRPVKSTFTQLEQVQYSLTLANGCIVLVMHVNSYLLCRWLF